MSLSLAGDKQDVVDYGNVIKSGWGKQDVVDYGNVIKSGWGQTGCSRLWQRH